VELNWQMFVMKLQFWPQEMPHKLLTYPNFRKPLKELWQVYKKEIYFLINRN